MNFLRPQLSFVGRHCADDIPTLERVKRGCNFQVSMLIIGYILLFIIVDLAILFGPSYIALNRSNLDSTVAIPALTITNTKEQELVATPKTYGQFASVPPVNSPLFYKSLTNNQVDPTLTNEVSNIFKTQRPAQTGAPIAMQQFLGQPQARQHLCSSKDAFQSCSRTNAVAFDQRLSKFVPASSCKSYCLPTSLVSQPGYDGVCQCQ